MNGIVSDSVFGWV